jgi:amidohydrolase
MIKPTRLLLTTAMITLLLTIECATAQPDSARLDSLTADAYDQVVQWRRHFHQYPELSNREFETAKTVAVALRDMGLEVETGVAHTGVVALLKGGKPGPVVALRADMDALPVTEQVDLPFASSVTSEYQGKQVGVMHACGHDTHIAMLLGAARVLTAVRDELPGSVLFIFQPAEEGAPLGEEGGAELMLKEGLFERYQPQAIFGMHIGLNMPGGQLAVRPGPAMAAVDYLQINVNGRQTHGARPWGGIDPIVVGSQIVMGLQTIASRQLNLTKVPYIITIGKFDAGVRNNIIPDMAEMHGTIRSFDAQMQDDMHARIRNTAEHIAASAGATAEVNIIKQYPATVNDPDLTAQMLPTLERVSGDLAVVTPDLVTGAEDFAFFAQEIPGVFVYLGAAAPDEEATELPSNHSPLFEVHEPNMELGVRAFVHLVADYLSAR